MIQRVELEISSDCNAACPGCARTQNIQLVRPKNLTLEQIHSWFPDPQGIKFKFCGVLGDPIVNPQCLEITKYLVDGGGEIQYSTNGARNSAAWWRELALLGVDVHWCIDGTSTNYIYRVNTNYNIIKRNMQAYSDSGGGGTWIYIVFDHNEHEVDEARSLAGELGFKFATRTGMRNSLHTWQAQIGKKNNREVKRITTTGAKAHSKIAVVRELDAFIQDTNKSQEQTRQIVNTIDCKYHHGNEIYIGADSTLWPCCFLYDSAFKNKESINDKYSIYPSDWNDLNTYTIQEILSTPYYQQTLRDSWDPQHSLHMPRCIRTCARAGAYQNEIIYS